MSTIKFSDLNVTDDEELLALDCATRNITGFVSHFGNCSEMVLDDGRVIRKIENTGGYNYSVVKEGLDFDTQQEYMSAVEGEWLEAEPTTVFSWLRNL